VSLIGTPKTKQTGATTKHKNIVATATKLIKHVERNVVKDSMKKVLLAERIFAGMVVMSIHRVKWETVGSLSLWKNDS